MLDPIFFPEESDSDPVNLRPDPQLWNVMACFDPRREGVLSTYRPRPGVGDIARVYGLTKENRLL